MESSVDVVERPQMAVDIACVGFGPAMGGFLTTMSRALGAGESALESRAAPGLPLQILCYERAGDIAFGVSGVATRARGIRASFPDLVATQIPMACDVRREKLVYLLDPLGTSRRSWVLRAADRGIRGLRRILPYRDDALEITCIPSFMRKDDGLLLSLGQFNAWVGAQLTASGHLQLWPGMPVQEPLLEKGGVAGVRLVDQGLDVHGSPEAGFAPGMDIRAALTVVGDGPVGAVGQRLDEHFGLPEGHVQHDWAVGMKMLVELPDGCPLQPGTVLHTLGYPEPEIFGFLYVCAENTASLGIFLPSWLRSPIRASYRYLQHWMQHPYLWRYLEGGTMRSWGAKTLQESGRRGEPHLVGEGYARIGEGSGSTNVLTGSGVDEAWTTGVLLAEGVMELLQHERPFTRANLEDAYVKRRRQSWVDREGRVAEHARDGFQRGFVRGLIGMALAGLSGGRLHLRTDAPNPRKNVPSLLEYYRDRIRPDEIEAIRQRCDASGEPLYDSLMDRCGWPRVRYDGKLLVSHQDALLLGGKVQAPPGYANHIVFLDPNVCMACQKKVCIGVCSGQAITSGTDGVPNFDREKCVHCGACVWNCTHTRTDAPGRGNIEMRAGAGGLHSVEN